MKLIIDIDENSRERIFDIANNGLDIPLGLENIMIMAITNGTPLPEHHGKLVDISKLDNDRIESDNPIIYLTINGEYIEAVSLDYLNSLPAIIPATKEGENE